MRKVISIVLLVFTLTLSIVSSSFARERVYRYRSGGGRHRTYRRSRYYYPRRYRTYRRYYPSRYYYHRPSRVYFYYDYYDPYYYDYGFDYYWY